MRLSLDAELYEIKQYKEKLQNCCVKYEGFVIPEDRVQLSKEEVQQIEAKYEAITTQMSMELQELERQHERQRMQSEKAVKELERLRKKFCLEENAWQGILFNEQEYRHQEILQEDRKKKLELKKNAWNEEDKQIGIVLSRISDKKKGILEQCGEEEPLAKSEIFTVDFDARKNQLEYQKKELGKEQRKVEKQLNSLKSQLDAVAEYADFEVKETLVWEEDFSQMEEEELRKFTGIMRRDYRQEMENLKKEKNRLEHILHALLRKDSYQEDYYRKPLHP